MINKYRKKIDKIDDKIVKLLTKRVETIELIAKYKETKGLPVLQKEREEEHLHEILEKCKESKLCKNYIHNVFEAIFEESRNIQKSS
jgi:chorismate mutase